MKRRYEVAYYEYGLTNRKRRRFFWGFIALLFMSWVKIKYGYESYVRLYEYELTEEKRRKFFTEIGANLFAWWLDFKYDVKTMIYSYE